MCRQATESRNLVLFEGQVKWIMERATPEERLAAWETIAAIAFPQGYELPYEPPKPNADGSPLSPCDRVRRDVYLMFKDIIESFHWEKYGEVKDPRKVKAGVASAIARETRRAESSTAEDSDSVDVSALGTMPLPPSNPQNMNSAEAFGGTPRGNFGKLTADDLRQIAKWRWKFPDAKLLKKYLDENYMFPNRKLVCTESFCDYAFVQLENSNWCSSRNGKPLMKLDFAIHWLAVDYTKRVGDIRRLEQEEKRKDMETDLAIQNTEISQLSPEDFAAIERKRRRQAEKEAMRKLMEADT